MPCHLQKYWRFQSRHSECKIHSETLLVLLEQNSGSQEVHENIVPIEFSYSDRSSSLDSKFTFLSMIYSGLFFISSNKLPI